MRAGEHGRVSEGDLFVRWAAAAEDARVWRRPDATVVACADLAHWDRLVMSGDPEALAALIRELMPVVGPTFRPFGPEDLVAQVVARVPELEVSAHFAWMETTEPVGGGPAGDHPGPHPAAEDDQESRRAAVGDRGTSRAAVGHRGTFRAAVGERGTLRDGEDERGPRWLGADEWPEVSALLAESFPDSYARPGASGVRRWAGIRDAGGRLTAVAADAWSTGEIGFLAGVTTHPDARGRGLAATLCTFAADELLAGRERVALLADYSNTAAVATYRKLGFRIRRVAAARQK
jgi:ribosomal protein S18 acetylase RimI-like enzyme